GGGGGAASADEAGGGGGAGSSFVIAGGTLETAIAATSLSPSITIVPVDTPPRIKTANTATFTVGTLGSFTVRATGDPIPALRYTGTFPQGLTFGDNHDGTALIYGTPMVQSGGSFTPTIVAENTDGHGVTHAANQPFALTNKSTPSFFSNTTVDFAIGSANT